MEGTEGTTTSFPQCKMTTLLPLRLEDYNKRLYDDGSGNGGG